MSWVEEEGNMATLKYSSFDGEKWSTPNTISQDSTWFVNWADYPSIISQNGTPLAAHWLNKKPGGTYAYDINISTYTDESWNPAIAPHLDNTATEHGFVSMEPASDSTFIAVWLDGRNTSGRSHDEYSDLSKAMTLRGALIHRNGSILESYLIDESVCDCCNTALTKTDDGFMVVYRNRTEDEIRDIYSSAFINGSWSKPKIVHQDSWKIAACPVNGPAIDAKNNMLATAWFTGAGNSNKIQLAISHDFGKSFTNKFIVSDRLPIGRVDVEIEDEIIWVSWLSSDNDKNNIFISSYSTSGKSLNTYKIPDIANKRQTGFPQLEIIDGKLLVVFTDASEDEKKVPVYYQQ
jgi:hypothetical protein